MARGRAGRRRRRTRDRRIFDLWLACWTNQDIADECGCDEKTVRDVIGETAELPKLRKQDQSAADHATDFEPPIYNVWKQQTKTDVATVAGSTAILVAVATAAGSTVILMAC